ncbi:MAG: DUF2812 domain-containing protein [Clostridium sp.]
MRILNYKWVIFNFLPFEVEVLERYLEEMALKGWKLKSICSRLLIFEKTDRRKIKYTVDINKEIESKGGEPSERILEYRDMCKNVGWNFVCQYERMQVFCTEEEEVIPIHTDKNERKEIIVKASLKYIFIDILLMITMFLNIYNIIGHDTEAKFLANNYILAIVGIFTLYVVMIATNIAKVLIWRKKEKLIRASYRGVKIRNYILNIMILIVIGILIITLGHGIESIKVIVFSMAIVFILGVIYSISHKKMKDESKIKFLNNFACITGMMIFIVIINVYSFNGSNEYINEERVPLKLSDFNDKVDEKDANYFDENESLFAKSINANLTGNKIYLDYNVFEGKNDMAMKIRLNRLKKYIKDFEKRMNIKLYNEVEVDFIKDMKVYSKNIDASYLLIGKDKVIEIDIWGKDEYMIEDKEEFLKVAYNKL